MSNQNQLIHLLLAFALPVILLLSISRANATTNLASSAIITVNSTANTIADDGQCTLPEAITAANEDSSSGMMANECTAGSLSLTDTINFNISGSGPHTISLSSELNITTPVIIDGTSQTGASCSSWPPTLQIILDGSLGNSNGLHITNGNSTIHGLVINQFNMSGIRLGGTNNIVTCNLIGTDVNGTTALSNTRGIQIFTGSDNTIGGTTSERNLISGNNESGIEIVLSSGNVIQGNYIGTDINGTSDLGNGNDGILIRLSASSNTVGGTTTGAGNIISGNNQNGISLSTNASNTTIQGNYIGTDVNGTADLGNSLDGITLSASSNNTIGGASSAARNIISGNNNDGVGILGTSASNVVQGNYIGTNVNGTTDLGNTSEGVTIQSGSNSNIVGTNGDGTDDTTEGNLISGNDSDGILVNGSDNNIIAGNYIGTQSDGNSALGNSSNGILINSASNNTIGGLSANTGNIIAHNTQDGVAVASGTGNAIDPNSIFSNGGLGIDLGNDGATSNDSNDADTGANNLQNFPSMTSASIDGSDRLVIEYTVDSTTISSTYPLRIEFFEADGGGEGQTFIGSDSYTTAQASQTVTFTNASGLGVSVGDPLVATATDAMSNTSEFGAVTIPLVVLLATFEAAPQQADILVSWQTTLELDNLGFNIWRGNDANTPQEQLNVALIPSASPGSGTGARYEWLDETVEAGETYYYWIEEVDTEGNLTRHGPVSITASIPTAVTINQISAISGRLEAFLWAMLLIGAVFGIGLMRRRV